MTTECTSTQLQFHPLGRRSVVAGFEGMQSSDGGALLLREVEQRTRIVQRLAAQFVDYRSPELIEHSVTDLLMQTRVWSGTRLRGSQRPRCVAPRSLVGAGDG